jgi:formylglycine-generating enzyme required for sulfatase activity
MLQATMAKQPKPRWWTIRPAQNRKPSTYRCPLCGNQLPSLQSHMLITPEGDPSRRRHAHSACVMAARKQGRLPTEGEWRKARRAAQREADRAGDSDTDSDRDRSIWSRLRALMHRDR